MRNNHFDFRNVPRGEDGLPLPALAGGDVTSRNQNSNVTSRNLPSSHRDVEREIYLFVSTSGRAVSRAEIAKHLELKKTNWLFGKIDSLVSSGFLSRNHGRHKNGVLMYFYEVNQ
jgi:DNA-directed RNA polymerase specialized sigma subunit